MSLSRPAGPLALLVAVASYPDSTWAADGAQGVSSSAWSGAAVVVLAALLVVHILWVGRLRRREHVLKELLAAREVELATAHRAAAAAADRSFEASIADEATGLYNRLHFDRLLDAEWRRAIRSGRPLAVIQIEVDELDAFARTHDRAALDECLATVATAIMVAHRAGDLVAHLGDGRFAAVLPETNLVGALLLGERMRSRVAALQIRSSSSPDAPNLTASVGVATTVPALGSSCAELVAAVDAALVSARSRGRDLVVPASVAPLTTATAPAGHKAAGTRAP